MNISVIIPTYLTYDRVAGMVNDLRKVTPANVSIHATCHKASASENRNRGLAMCEIGDIAIMIDDDMRGFYPGWVDDLIAPLITGGVSMVSARLITESKQIAPCQGDTGDLTSPYFAADQQKVPSAAIAFFNDGTLFDEQYGGAGWEDSVTGDMPIIVKNKGEISVIPISHLYTNIDDGRQFLSGYEVWSRTGWNKVNYVYKHTVKKKIYQIRTRSGIIHVTGDHSLFRNGKEISVKDLEIGDRIDIADFPDFINNGFVDNEWCLGLFSAEGSACEHKYFVKSRKSWYWMSSRNVRYSMKDEQSIDRVCKEIGFKKYKCSDGMFAAHKLNCSIDDVKKYIELNYSSDRNKIVPKNILNSCIESRREYLKGFLKGDGHVETPTSKNKYSYDREHYTSKSFPLMLGVQMILKEHGRFASVNCRKDKNTVNLRLLNGRLGTNQHGVKNNNLDDDGTVIDIQDVTRYYENEYGFSEVYDINTNDGTFVAGLGGIIAHNTDFCRKIVQRYPEKHIVINNRCQLVHLNESKHEGANTANHQYFDARWKYNLSVDTLVFSKDRPAQLDLLIQSMRDYFSVANNGINVLYRSTNAIYESGYATIARKYRNVNLIKESDFKKDTEAIVDSFSEKHCMFFADDEIFVNAPDMVALMAAFTDDVASVSLRLGKSVNYCQPARKEMPLPQFIKDDKILKWNWTQGDLFTDWYYPRSLIGTIHRTQTIKDVLHRPDAHYRNPNELECAFHPISADTGRPNMVSMPYSCIVSVPANLTSELSNTANLGIDTAQIAQQYNDGWRIWPGDFYGMKNNNSCFPEIPYAMHRPRIGVFFERTGRVNGCQKVALNTIAGLEKLGLPYSENRIETYNGALHMVKDVRTLPANTVIGPESMVLPDEHIDMWRLFNNWTTPCEWVTRSYRTAGCAQNARITEWPAGIDTDRFNDTDRAPEYDCFVFYKNVTKQTPPEALAGVKAALDTRHLTYTVLAYGSYQEAELIEATKKARFAIWLVGTESQNIALLEVLSCGVPVYVIDETTFMYSTFTMSGATSAPYFDDRCGMKAPSIDGIDTFIKALKHYHPREYVLEYFTLEKCAQAYYDMIIQALEY